MARKAYLGSLVKKFKDSFTIYKNKNKLGGKNTKTQDGGLIADYTQIADYIQIADYTQIADNT